MLFPRIVIAEMQNVVYGQYVPDILGPETVTRFDLGIDEASDYNPDTDPSIINAFSTAAYRFGHSLIVNKVLIKDVDSAAETFYRDDSHEYDLLLLKYN